jgi:hypothetical protein
VSLKIAERDTRVSADAFVCWNPKQLLDDLVAREVPLTLRTLDERKAHFQSFVAAAQFVTSLIAEYRRIAPSLSRRRLTKLANQLKKLSELTRMAHALPLVQQSGFVGPTPEYERMRFGPMADLLTSELDRFEGLLPTRRSHRAPKS